MDLSAKVIRISSCGLNSRSWSSSSGRKIIFIYAASLTGTKVNVPEVATVGRKYFWKICSILAVIEFYTWNITKFLA